MTQYRTPAAVLPEPAQVTKFDGGVLRLESRLDQSQHVTFTSGILASENPVLRECLGTRNALVVCTPSVERLYGRQLRAYLSTLPAHARVEVMVLRRSESSKSLQAVTEVCERAASGGLQRRSPIIAIGGGVCTDICGLAAALYRRGVPHFKVPTTLVGLIDAGIGTKNAVNHQDRKSALGTFHPPEHAILDPDFVATVPRRHILSGMAEILKLAIVADTELFGLLVEYGSELVDSSFRIPTVASAQVIRRAVTGMLTELSANPFETTHYQRKVDFGHTFSPYVEVASGYTVLHGEAVAMDIALSSQLAWELGLLTEDQLDRILTLMRDLGLPLTQCRSDRAAWAGQ